MPAEKAELRCVEHVEESVTSRHDSRNAYKIKTECVDYVAMTNLFSTGMACGTRMFRAILVKIFLHCNRHVSFFFFFFRLPFFVFSLRIDLRIAISQDNQRAFIFRSCQLAPLAKNLDEWTVKARFLMVQKVVSPHLNGDEGLE